MTGACPFCGETAVGAKGGRVHKDSCKLLTLVPHRIAENQDQVMSVPDWLLSPSTIPSDLVSELRLACAKLRYPVTGAQQLFEDALKAAPPMWNLSTLWMVLPFAWFQKDAPTEMKRALALAHRWARAHQRGFSRLNGYHCDL